LARLDVEDPVWGAMKFGHDTLMGIGLVASGGLTFAYTRVPSKTLLILTLIGAAVTVIIGVLLFFGLA
jgi:ABC-type enterochelin transport system permease subunit